MCEDCKCRKIHFSRNALNAEKYTEAEKKQKIPLRLNVLKLWGFPGWFPSGALHNNSYQSQRHGKMCQMLLEGSGVWGKITASQKGKNWVRDC